MPGMEMFTIVYLILFIVVPVVLISLFIGLVALSLRKGGDGGEESTSASSSPEVEA